MHVVFVSYGVACWFQQRRGGEAYKQAKLKQRMGALHSVTKALNDVSVQLGNFLINDMKNIEGGDLEIIKMEKRAGMKALVNGTLRPEQLERISYEAPGKMMLCQGSEILHHVTPIRSCVLRMITTFKP